jgi:hypothetical protein
VRGFADTPGSLIQVQQTPSAFHSLAQRNAFRRRGARLQQKIVLALESIAETQRQLQPPLLSLSAMISQYFINAETP